MPHKLPLKGRDPFNASPCGFPGSSFCVTIVSDFARTFDLGKRLFNSLPLFGGKGIVKMEVFASTFVYAYRGSRTLTNVPRPGVLAMEMVP